MIFQCSASTWVSCRFPRRARATIPHSPFSVPALLPLASMPAVSLVGLVDTPTQVLPPPLPSPFTMGNTTCTSFRMPFLFCPAQPVSCLQVTVRSLPKPRARSTSFLLCGSGSRSGSSSGSRVRDSETFNSADWLQSTIVCSLYSIYFQLGG